jgi:hypothetical protein
MVARHGGECRAAAYLGKGENNGEEEETSIVDPFPRWKRGREGGGGPAGR